MLDRRQWLAATGSALLAGFVPRESIAGVSAPAFASRRFAVTTRGAPSARGRDIILIPGLASGPGVWNSLVHALLDHRWHLVHIRGFAGLPADLNGKGPLLGPLADELLRYIRDAKLRRPAVIGHSMGGTLAMLAALRPASPIERLMVVDMLPDGAAMLGGTSAGLGYLAGQLNGYLTGTKAGRRLLADMVRQSPGGRDSDPQVIAQALAELAQNDLAPALHSYARPLTVIYANPADAKLRPAQAQRYAAAYRAVRQARLRAIGPSGHMVMLDQPARFSQAVKDFLD